MSKLHAGIAAFEANSRARAQAERDAGRVWRDTVLRRFTDRTLEPLAAEERRFVRALAVFDQSIDCALRELDRH